MRKTLATILLATIALTGLPGCQSTGSQTGEPTNLPILARQHGQDADIAHQGITVINSAPALAQLAGEQLGNGELEINFDDYSLVVLALGERPTGG